MLARLPGARAREVAKALEPAGFLFDRQQAKKLVADKGYELVRELRPVGQHFELLGKKDGKFYELLAHRDGNLIRNRPVDASDPRWGPLAR